MIGVLLLGTSLLLGAAPGEAPFPAKDLRAPVAGPLPGDAVVYFVMVDRFADGDPVDEPDEQDPRRFHGGDLDGLRACLPYLSELGVTHLWITSQQKQIDELVGDTEAYHGYWPAALEAHADSKNERALRGLIDAAARFRIRVILDLVANHLGYGAPDPQHLVRDACGDDDTTRCLFGLPDLATEDRRVRSIVVHKVASWTRLFPDLAGVRLDAFKHIDAKTQRELHDALRPSYADRPDLRVSADYPAPPRFTVIAEDWGATVGDAHVDDAVNAGRADAFFDFGFYGPARDFLQGRMRSAAFAHALEVRERAATSTTAQTLPFLDNHDVETWTHAVGAARSPIGAALLLSDREVPVITWGTEVQRAGGAGDPENRSDMPWDAVLLQKKDPTSSLAFWKSAIRLRHRHAVLHTGALQIVGKDGDDSAPHFLVYARERPRHRAVVAVALDRPLRHVEPLNGKHIIDTAAWHGRAKEDAGNLVVDVDKDGAVIVVVGDAAGER